MSQAKELRDKAKSRHTLWKELDSKVYSESELFVPLKDTLGLIKENKDLKAGLDRIRIESNISMIHYICDEKLKK